MLRVIETGIAGSGVGMSGADAGDGEMDGWMDGDVETAGAPGL